MYEMPFRKLFTKMNSLNDFENYRPTIYYFVVMKLVYN